MPNTALIIQSTLDRLANLLRGDLRQALLKYGLQPVQFEALCYLSHCNRYSDTAMAVTEYLGQTKGTVSQSLKVLERECLVKKIADKVDKRVSHLKVTTKGQRIVDQVLPSTVLVHGLKHLTGQEQDTIAKQLRSLLLALQAGNQFKSFEQCQTCIHNQRAANGIVCGLTQEPLTVAETKLICREHAIVN